MAAYYMYIEGRRKEGIIVEKYFPAAEDKIPEMLKCIEECA